MDCASKMNFDLRQHEVVVIRMIEEGITKSNEATFDQKFKVGSKTHFKVSLASTDESNHSCQIFRLNCQGLSKEVNKTIQRKVKIVCIQGSVIKANPSYFNVAFAVNF